MSLDSHAWERTLSTAILHPSPTLEKGQAHTPRGSRVLEISVHSGIGIKVAVHAALDSIPVGELNAVNRMLMNNKNAIFDCAVVVRQYPIDNTTVSDDRYCRYVSCEQDLAVYPVINEQSKALGLADGDTRVLAVADCHSNVKLAYMYKQCVRLPGWCTKPNANCPVVSLSFPTGNQKLKRNLIERSIKSA
jgi:hypothetical protein